MKLISIIKCPYCGFEKEEEMPVNACVVAYKCSKCRKELLPMPGDCCVFCSYGSIKCAAVRRGDADDK